MKILWLLLSITLLSLDVYAETPEQRGLAIATEMDQRDTGWGDQTSEMLMVLRNRQGEESKRQIRTRALEVKGDGDKSMSIFDHPRDIKGTAFLSYTHAIKPDDQWLYLPALKRVKRINSRNKSGPFMGSEFAYEDLSSQEIDKYSYKYLRDEELNGKKTLVIERYPEYKHSSYTRQIVWIQEDIYRPVKTEYYDRKNSSLKTLDVSRHQQYLDKYWRPEEMFMQNHQTGKSTRLTWSNYRFKSGLTDRNFDRNSLKRAR